MATGGLRRAHALVPLSRDHHGALLQARALRRAAAGEPAAARRVAGSFLAFVGSELRGHMQDEERALLPVTEAVDPEGAARIRSEHAELLSLAASLQGTLARGGDPRPRLAELGGLLEAHVRFEERGHFMTAQARLSPEQMTSLGRALLAHREARGQAPSCPLPPGVT
jgi:hypothetical protein